MEATSRTATARSMPLLLLLASLQLAGGFLGGRANIPSRNTCRRAATSNVALAEETGTKYLTCSRCKATYEIDISDFGTGKQVKCSNCEHEWFQTPNRLQDMPRDMELVEYPEEMKARMAAGKPAEAIGRYRCFVGNLPYSVSEDELREVFER